MELQEKFNKSSSDVKDFSHPLERPEVIGSRHERYCSFARSVCLFVCLFSLSVSSCDI
jgi:hypothetical protein